jgi:hypothetical protein
MPGCSRENLIGRGECAPLQPVKTILFTGADMQPISEPHTPAAYARSRFGRSAASLFGSGDRFDTDPTTVAGNYAASLMFIANQVAA